MYDFVRSYGSVPAFYFSDLYGSRFFISPFFTVPAFYFHDSYSCRFLFPRSPTTFPLILIVWFPYRLIFVENMMMIVRRTLSGFYFSFHAFHDVKVILVPFYCMFSLTTVIAHALWPPTASRRLPPPVSDYVIAHHQIDVAVCSRTAIIPLSPCRQVRFVGNWLRLLRQFLFYTMVTPASKNKLFRRGFTSAQSRLGWNLHRTLATILVEVLSIIGPLRPLP